MSDPVDDSGDRWAALRRRFVGDLDAMGWSVLPLFVAVGLAGAVMAGALAVVYYSQQVSDLERETRDARLEVEGAVEAVEDAASDALSAIASEVEAVQDVLNRRAPVDDVAPLGLVVVEARVLSPPPPSATVTPTPPDQASPTDDQTESAPASDTTPQGAPVPLAQGSEPATPADPSGPAPDQEPPPRAVVPRVGVGFAVAFEDGQLFVATSHALVADPESRAGVVEEVVVTLPDGSRPVGIVHSWDENRGIALLRVGAGALPVGPWRPRTEPLDVGDRLTIVGLTPDREPVQVDGTVGFADAEAIIASFPNNQFLRGAPVLDRQGRVVAIYTPNYRPYGEAAGTGQALAPVTLLCESMLNGCEGLEAPSTEAPTEG